MTRCGPSPANFAVTDNAAFLQPCGTVSSGSVGSSDNSTSQLVQAMAGFGGSSGVAESLNTAPLGADTSQQPFESSRDETNLSHPHRGQAHPHHFEGKGRQIARRLLGLGGCEGVEPEEVLELRAS